VFGTPLPVAGPIATQTIDIGFGRTLDVTYENNSRGSGDQVETLKVEWFFPSSGSGVAWPRPLTEYRKAYASYADRYYSI